MATVPEHFQTALWRRDIASSRAEPCDESSTKNFDKASIKIRSNIQSQFGDASWYKDHLESVGTNEKDASVLAKEFIAALRQIPQVQEIIGEQHWMYEQLLPGILEPPKQLNSRIVGKNGLIGVLVAVGGMGQIWRVSWKGQQAVVKIAITEDTRFKEEIEVLELLDGEGSPKLYESGKMPGEEQRYCVMEDINGWSLETILREAACKRLPKQLCYDVLALVAANLQQLHDKRLFHRDLKPSNIMIDMRNGGSVKLIDFGLKGEEEHSRTRLTHSNQVMGSPEYMAPEQINTPQLATKKVDVYALGCIAHKMFTGKVPFTGETPMAVMEQQSSATKVIDKSAFEDDADFSNDEELMEFHLGTLDKSPIIRKKMTEVLAFYFDRSTFKKQYDTIADFLATPSAKRTLPLESLPNVSNSTEVVQQGSVNVPTPGTTFTALHRFYSVQDTISMNQAPKKPKNKKKGIGKATLATAGGVAMGIAAAMFALTRDSSDPQDPSGTPDQSKIVKQKVKHSLEIDETGHYVSFLKGTKNSVELGPDEGIYIYDENNELVGVVRPFTEKDRARVRGHAVTDGSKSMPMYQLILRNPNTKKAAHFIELGDMSRLFRKEDGTLIGIYEQEAHRRWPIFAGTDRQEFWGDIVFMQDYIDAYAPTPQILEKKLIAIRRGQPFADHHIYKDFPDEHWLKNFRSTLNRNLNMGKKISQLETPQQDKGDIRSALAMNVVPYTREQMLAAFRARDPKGKYTRI